MILDQENEGACTGFGLSSVINSVRWYRAVLQIEADAGLSIHAAAEPPDKVSPLML